MIASAAHAQDHAINYEDTIQPVFRQYCMGCHNQSRARNGLKLDSYAGLMQGGSSGAAIVKGDPGNSLIYLVMAHEREPFMPDLEPKLPDEIINQVREWIAAGAPATKDDRSYSPDRAAPSKTLDPALLARPEGAPAMPADLRTDPYWWSERPTTITALAASPFAPLIAVGGLHQVILCHSESNELLGVLDFPEGDIHVLRFSRDGALLLAGGGLGAESGRVVAWDVTSGERVLEIGEETDVVLAADISEDRSLVALGGPAGIVRVFDTASGSIVYEIEKHTDWITSLAFSPDGVLLATGDRAGGAFVWESWTGREFHTLPTHTDRVTAIAWRPDSQIFATAGADARVRVLEAENGREQRSWQSHSGVLDMAFDQQGRLATAGRDGVARLWTIDGQQQMQSSGMNDQATSVAVSHDGSRVFVGDWTGAVRAFNAADGAALADLAVVIDTPWQRAVVRERANLSSAERLAAESAGNVDALTADVDRKRTQTAQLEGAANDAQARLDAARADVAEATRIHEAAQAGLSSFAEKLETRRSAEAASAACVAAIAREDAQAREKLLDAVEREASAAAATDRALTALAAARRALQQSPDDPVLEQAADEAASHLRDAEHEHALCVELLAGARSLAREAAASLARSHIDAEAARSEVAAWERANAEAVAEAHSAIESSKVVFARHGSLQIEADAARTAHAQAADDLARAEAAAAAAAQERERAAGALAAAQAALAAAEQAWADVRRRIDADHGRVPQQ